ncbi:K02A2.6-like [Cordylochernes scorpioides]|uniref:RNA-directed DNA polymerase n=1 Tax=Cordylochernes scorpioides TaxID=51811 RepID=A0ABY6JWB7_9ARAC|nr:K02A2.6-like [Cordylochernes scorpioides]
MRNYMVRVQTSGRDINMLIDSGTGKNIISEKTYIETWVKSEWPRIEKDATKLVQWNRQRLSILGKIRADVKVNKRNITMELLVVEGPGPNLIGREAFDQIGIGLEWINYGDSVCQITEEFMDVFKEKLGQYRGPPIHIKIKTLGKPTFLRPRTLPYEIRPKVEEALRKMEEQGVLTPVEFTRFATPIVPVLKRDGSIRICGDYRSTVNTIVEFDTFPVPAAADLQVNLAGGKVFSKLDLKDAYQQLVVDEETAELLAINTHKGLFKVNRLPFGISCAPGIFQRRMESLIAKIPGVVVYLDDILVTGKDEMEHDLRLREVLKSIQRMGLTLKKEKCEYKKSSLIFLGCRIDAEGIHPTEEKCEAIKNFPKPENKKELQSFLGLLNFYSKFLKDRTTVLEPLHRLLNKINCWKWKEVEDRAFREAKNLIQSDLVLTPYDARKPLVLACDSSPFGVGAVLSHVEERMDGRTYRLTTRMNRLHPKESEDSENGKEHFQNRFKSQENVYARKYNGKGKWEPGKIKTVLGPRNYEVIMENGVTAKRHQDQLMRRVKEEVSEDVEKKEECNTERRGEQMNDPNESQERLEETPGPSRPIRNWRLPQYLKDCATNWGMRRCGSNHREETDLPPFDGTYAARQFFQAYDLDDALVTTPDKLLRLPTYLTRQPLELFRKLRMATQSYFQVRQTLLDLYPESNQASFAKYFAMKLAGQASLVEYFRGKTAMGMQLAFTGAHQLRVTTRSNRPTCQAHTPAHQEEQVRGPHLHRRQTANSAAPITGTMNADTNQLNTRAREQCNQPNIRSTPNIHHKTKRKPDKPPETPQPFANQDNFHTKHTRDHTSSHNRHTRKHRNKRDTRTKRRQKHRSDTCTITDGTTTPLTRNMETIHAIQPPHNRKTLRSLLGAVNAYKKFIPDYARLRTPLNNLLKKDVTWVWDDKCQKAFTSLKEGLTTRPILHLYKEGLPCQVYCDASTLDIAGVLKQVHPRWEDLPSASLIKSHQPSPSGNSKLTIDHNGLHTISRKGVTKIIILKTLTKKLLQSVHTQNNHPSISKMTRLISTQYYWQDMSQDIAQKKRQVKKRAYLLTLIGGKAYDTLKNLCSPKLPKEYKYEELIEKLVEYFSPRRSIIVERFMFFGRIQKETESVSEYLVEIKRLASTCGFGEFLKESLRDKLVCGLRNAKIQRRILSEGDVPLARVVEIALSMEAAEKNTRIFHVNEPADSVDKIRAEVRNRYDREQKRKCIHCGRLHKDLCRFREATCFRCGKRGHLATICRSREEHTSERQVSRFLNQRKINQIEDQEEEEEESVQRMVFMRTYDYRVKYATNDPPYVIKVRVEDTLMTFEIDTGSCLTLISEKDFKRYLPDVQVKEAGIIVKTYDGTVVPILGEIDVKVDFRGTIAKLRAVVMPLEDTLAELLSEHQVVFGETTDPIKGFPFAVNIQDVNPIFHKARQVPFAIRMAVNEVLERMVEKDYLYQVPSSKWATPVVVVPKKNKEFRILKRKLKLYRECFSLKIEIFMFHLSIPHPQRECEEAISECKKRITSEKVLVPYDATLPLSLATDASQIGVGAVLSHVIEGQEKPIMFASRTLSGAERNYSQIEREALAIIYGVTKFHQFIYGRQFTLITDHKPLVSILWPRAGIPTLSTSRLQRWGLTLAAYTYEIKFQRTQDHGNADLLSRLPVESDEKPVLNQTFILSYVEDLPVTAAEIGAETKNDEVLSVVKRYTQQGWPERVGEYLRHYFQRKLELTMDGDCLLCVGNASDHPVFS